MGKSTTAVAVATAATIFLLWDRKKGKRGGKWVKRGKRGKRGKYSNPLYALLTALI